MSASGSSDKGGCWGIAAIVLVIGVIVQFWAWILGVLAVTLVVWIAVKLIEYEIGASARRREKRAAVARRERERREDLLERAQKQHEACLRGEAYGVFGAYPPAELPELPGAD